MRTVHIIPGSGGTFYCQNCLRDNALVKELRRQGHDSVMVPMYLPMFTDDPLLQTEAPVFYGAVSLYLKQKIPLLRHLPLWLTGLLDAPCILAFAAKKAGSTRASGLEDMTLSMLRGEDGNQSDELEQLIQWLEHEEKPDAIHISNALLLGMARQLKERLDVPIICSLQDEHQWVDQMDAGSAARVWALVGEKGAFVDAFVAVSRYYAEEMSSRFDIPADKLHVVPVGIDLDGYQESQLPKQPGVIGYLSRMSRSLGFELVVDAFITLCCEEGMDLRLRVSGGMTADDHEFIAEMKERLRDRGLLDRVEFVDDMTRDERIRFVQSLTVLTVPIPEGEAFGTYMLEAMACGVPCVQPKVGAFPEVIEDTGGGVIYDPNTPEELAVTLKAILSNREKLQALGKTGRAAVHDRYSIKQMAENILQICRQIEQSNQRG